MDVILSIKPKFAEKILPGTKKFEYRRVILKNKEVKKVVVYTSAPISKIVGTFEIDEILHNDIDNLWSLFVFLQKNNLHATACLSIYSFFISIKASFY